MRAHSLRGRLLAAMIAVFALGLAASLASYRFAFHNIVSDLRQRTLQAQARELTGAMRPRAGGGLDVDLPQGWRAVYADPSRTFTYTVYDRSGRPVSWSPNLGAQPIEMETGPTGPGQHGHAHGHADGHPRVLDRIELVGAGREERAVLATAAPGGYLLLVERGGLSRDDLIDSLFEESGEHLAILAPVALFAVALIWLVSGWSLRPVDRASREAALIGPRQSEARISLEGLPREMLPLVRAVNGALDRLSRAYAAEKRLTSDAAHALRTPLAVLTLRLQRARLTGATDWTAIERELGEMRRLVDQLLDLARKESRRQETSAAEQPLINLARVVREVAASMVPLMDSADRHLEIDVPDGAPMRGRAEDLRDMLRNLLDNALLHGRGTVTVRLHADGPTLLLEVMDEGSGVPAGREEAVFDRFCKLEAAAPGSGLGLAIVRQVARSHGGDARFLPGRGSVLVTLPGTADLPTAAPTAPSPCAEAEMAADSELPR